MPRQKPDGNPKRGTAFKVLVAVDFSESSARALRMSKTIMGRTPEKIVVLHVIDHAFVTACIKNGIGTEGQIKKALFLKAKKRLEDFLEKEGMGGPPVEEVISEGIPFLEINKQAVETGADMIVMGNRGNSGDMETIFLGSTTERVLRFMKRPVLCVPIEEDRKP